MNQRRDDRPCLSTSTSDDEEVDDEDSASENDNMLPLDKLEVMNKIVKLSSDSIASVAGEHSACSKHLATCASCVRNGVHNMDSATRQKQRQFSEKDNTSSRGPQKLEHIMFQEEEEQRKYDCDTCNACLNFAKHRKVGDPLSKGQEVVNDASSEYIHCAKKFKNAATCKKLLKSSPGKTYK